ncbi:MAG: GAD domain-containing protein, partial [Candidatus Micrarchaeaceae archaeon]
KSGGTVHGFALHRFKGIIGKEVNPDRRLGSEISDYAKMGGVSGIIHSDENLEGYGFTAEEVAGIQKELGTGPDDAFVIISGKAEAVETAMRLAISRAAAAIETGVIPETRAAVDNNLFTTRFLRPLPGGFRMYPETDANPIEIMEDMLAKAKEEAPDIEKTQKRLLEELSSSQLAEQMMLSPKLQLYNEISKQTAADKAFIANTLIQKFTELRRSNYNVEGISAGRLVEIFDAYASGKVTKNGVEELLKVISTKDTTVQQAIRDLGIGRISGLALKRLVKEAQKDGAKGKDSIISAVMSKHRLNVDGEELNSILQKMVR